MSVEARLVELLDTARSVQWSPGLLQRVESEGRIIGEHSDPTPHIALDERRLAVRAAVRKAERFLTDPYRAGVTAGDVVEQLEAALDEWATRR